MKVQAFKLIAQDTHVPGVGTYSGCAVVVIEESVEAAKEAVKRYAVERGHDVRWVDHCRAEPAEIEQGKVLIFVMQ